MGWATVLDEPPLGQQGSWEAEHLGACPPWAGEHGCGCWCWGCHACWGMFAAIASCQHGQEVLFPFMGLSPGS